jgi:hypothetical protein
MRRIDAVMFIAAICACMPMQCTMNVADGNSSGTGNSGITVSALLDRIDGTTVHDAEVQLYSQDWMPHLRSGLFAEAAVADDSGNFSFTGIPAGSFNLIVYSPNRTYAGIVRGIVVSADSTWADSIGPLQKPGAIDGVAMTRDSAILAMSFVYIRGTPFSRMSDNRGNFSIVEIPPAQYNMQFYGLYTTNPEEEVAPVSFPSGPISDSVVIDVSADGITRYNPPPGD